MMTDINKLAELAKKATPGPWSSATDWERAAVYSTSPEAYPQGKRVVCSGNQNNHKRFNAEPWSGSDWNDAAFIAAANPAAILDIAAQMAEKDKRIAELEKDSQDIAKLAGANAARAQKAEAEIARRDKAADECVYQERRYYFKGKNAVEYWADVNRGCYLQIHDTQRRVLYAKPRPVPAALPLAAPNNRNAIEALSKLNNGLYRWTSRMSYNDSWVGEPSGLIKGTIREMEKIIDQALKDAEALGAKPFVVKLPKPEQSEDDSWWYAAEKVDSAIRAAGGELEGAE